MFAESAGSHKMRGCGNVAGQSKLMPPLTPGWSIQRRTLEEVKSISVLQTKCLLDGPAALENPCPHSFLMSELGPTIPASFQNQLCGIRRPNLEQILNEFPENGPEKMQINAGFHPLLLCEHLELVHWDKQLVAPILQSVPLKHSSRRACNTMT